MEILHQIDAFFSQFTVIHDGKSSSDKLLIAHTYDLPLVVTILYLAMVFGLPRLLRNKKGWDLPLVFASWNLGLAVLSLLMFIGVSVPYVRHIQQHGFFAVFCDADQKILFNGPQTILFWSYLFALSKYVELIDTLLLIIKNPDRPVIFLHWYHHTTVLLFTWFAAYWRLSTGFVFVIMNALIHTFMYYYYFLTSLGYRPAWGKALTIGQISQMFVGIISIAYWMYLRFYVGLNCSCDKPDLLALSCAVMYGSYLFLFCRFFVKRYLSPRPASRGGRSSSSKENTTTTTTTSLKTGQVDNTVRPNKKAD